jgi:hypothetical protein
MIFAWVIAYLIMDTDYGLFASFAVCALIIATFVLSIIHLRKYQQKALAITALVISSIGVLFILMGFMLGAASVM